MSAGLSAFLGAVIFFVCFVCFIMTSNLLIDRLVNTPEAVYEGDGFILN